MKKGGTRNNAMLKSWVKFVKQVQKEEKLGYKDAMMRAKARKSEWHRASKKSTKKHRYRGGDGDDEKDVDDRRDGIVDDEEEIEAESKESKMINKDLRENKDDLRINREDLIADLKRMYPDISGGGKRRKSRRNKKRGATRRHRK